MRIGLSFTAMVLIIGLLAGGAQSVGLESYDGTVMWDAPTTNADGTPLKDLAKYRLYRRASADLKTTRVLVTEVSKDIRIVSTKAVKLAAGQHYFTVTAVDTSGNESAEQPAPVAFVQLVKDLRPKNFRITNITENAARVQFDQDPLAKANIRYMPKPMAWGAAKSIECPLNVCELKDLPPNTAIDVQGIGYTGEMNTPTVEYTPFADVVSFQTKESVIIQPPPATGDKFTILLNKGNNIVAQYKAADCPKGISQTTSGTTTKIVTWTCKK